MTRSRNITASEALSELRAGNQRFVSGSPTGPRNAPRRAELLDGQSPKAVIVGCSDSRVPAEIIFDQGFGDLFVIRVAGNIVAPSQIGSVEFAIEQFGTALVVVVGHTHCGAITAAIDSIRNPGTHHSRNLLSIVDRITPALEGLDAHDLEGLAVAANVAHSVDQLRRGSPLLEKFARESGVRTIGAVYSLESGIVTFLDD
jgi:carbonic anhydrase